MQNCPRNRPTNTKISSFELKWAKSQTKETEMLKRWFYPGDMVTGTGGPGDWCRMRESWHIWDSVELLTQHQTDSDAALSSEPGLTGRECTRLQSREVKVAKLCMYVRMYVCKSLFKHRKSSVKFKLKTKTNYNCFTWLPCGNPIYQLPSWYCA